MKKLMLVILLGAMMACNSNNNENRTDGDDASNSNANRTENSGENISPQLENQSDTRLQVDTVHNSDAVKDQAEDNNLK